MSAPPDYIRLCPVCGTAAAADATQCVQCNTLLLGVDLTLRQAAAVAAPPPVAAAPPAAGGPHCPHADCGQANPPGNADCLYCGRPLAGAQAPATVPSPSTFPYRLPTPLAEKFRILEVLPAGGAEAEIMILAGLTSGVKVVAKLYRPGCAPKTEVLERVGRAGFPHVVRVIAHGVADGVGYELMEYCAAGSLRQWMAAGPLSHAVLRQILEEIATALAALHGLDVIHRDLKPENVLVRRREPLDLVLTDFGTASVNEATQRFTTLARTVKYGAPETLAGIIDRAADYWSLGLILVELLTGRHPFDGLSDAVITHQLVTGNVDLAEVAAPDWRLLCRGLLLRDPQQRWGAAEIRRWLSGDDSLDVPQTADLAPPGFHSLRPYRIGTASCRSAHELAVALASQWESGCKDLMRGQLSGWVGRELQDDNLLRFIQDQLELRDASDDLRLFRLIRLMAPAMPPVWRGASLAVANLLAQAARAVGGDATAAGWLLSVFDEKVLRELAPAQFPEEAALIARWEAAYARFALLWRATENALTQWRKTQTGHNGLTDFDALVFGQPTALALPAPARLHPPLLLTLADESFAPALRVRIHNASSTCLADNPWFEALLAGDDPLAWLTAEFLAPQARNIAEDVQKREQRETQAESVRWQTLIARSNQTLALLRETSRTGPFSGAGERGACAAAVQAFLELIEEARREGVADDTPLMRALHRAEPVVLRMQDQLDAWEHAAAINAAWRNRNLGQGIGGFLLVGLVFAAETLPMRFFLWALLLLAAVIGWRLWGLMQICSRLHQLGEALPLRVATVPPPPMPT